MKKNILNLLACTAFCLSIFTACDTDAEGALYESDKIEYAFASSLQKIELLPADGNKIIVPVYRTTTAGSSTVEVTLTAENEVTEGIFSLAGSTVTFEEGKAEAQAVVTYEDINQLGAADIYEFSLSFDEATASPSKDNSIKVTAQRRLTFKSIGEGIFTSSFFTDENGNPYSAPQVVEKAEEANVYRLPDVYAEGYPLIFAINTEGNISFSDQETGYVHPSYGMVSVHLVDAAKECDTYMFSLQFFCSAGSFGVAVESIQMPK